LTDLDPITIADTLITPTIFGGFGGFGTSALETLERTYFPAGRLPAGTMALALDTCDQNPFGRRVDKGQIMYHELSFDNPAASLEEMLRAHPEWAASLDPERLRFDRVRIATTGVLKHHARLLATALRNRALIDQISAGARKHLSDQTSPRLNHGVLETFSFAGGCGGTGLPLAEFMRLRDHARADATGITSWHEGWFLGPANYPPHQVMTRWYKMNFATEMRFLSRVVAHGTTIGDPRFNPVLPGLEDLLDIASGPGKGRLLPGAFDQVVIFDPRSTKGKSLPIEYLLEMMASCAFWRSRLPMLSAMIRELVIETRDHRAAAETEEGVSYCCGGIGGRFVELHPQLPAVQQHLLEHSLCQAILSGGQGAGAPTIDFNRSRLDQVGADWREELNRHNFRLASPERLSAAMAANPRSELSSMLKRIEDMEEHVRETVDQRGELSAASEALQSELAVAVKAAKSQFGLRALRVPLQRLKADISALLARSQAASATPLSDGWKDEFWQTAAPILPTTTTVSEPETEVTPVNVGLLGAMWLNIKERLLRRVRRQARSGSSRSLTNHPLLPVLVHDLCEKERAMRDYMIGTRLEGVASGLVDFLAGEEEQLSQQVFEAEGLETESLSAAKALLESRAGENPVRYTVQPSIEFLLGKAEPAPDRVRETWDRVFAGEPLKEAVSYEVGGAISFAELVAADSGVVEFLRMAVRDVAPHVSLRADEVTEMPEQYFLVFPEELRGYLEGMHLHKVGPWINMPVAGLSAIVIYAMAYGLPARALQSVAESEPALRDPQTTDGERYESSLFPEYRNLPSVFAADRRVTEEIMAAAMICHANIKQDDIFPLALGQVQVTGPLFNPNPCPFQMDADGNFQVVVAVPGGSTHRRPLRTDRFSVAVDLVNERKAEYLDPLRAYLATVAKSGDYLAAEVLKGTVKAIGVWLAERAITHEDQEFTELGVADQKVTAAEVAALPTVEIIYRALERFEETDWVAYYKSVAEGKVVDLTAARRRLRRRTI